MGPSVLGQPVRYVIVGGWNTAFGLALFSILYLAFGRTLGYLTVLTIAQVVAVLQAHAMQRAFVWRSRAPYRPELLRFSAVYAGTYLANVLLPVISVDALGFPVLRAQWTLGGILIIVTYVIQRAWTFRDPVRRLSRSG